tara:strand:+ start:4067 stop:5671 length:1605 start_codon:yes stop_codon:yes gene_type:complete
MSEIAAKMITESARVIALDSSHDEDQVISDLAKLSSMDYERQREGAAKALGIKRVSTLDKIVKQYRIDQEVKPESNELKNGIEPWHDPVNGQMLASSIIKAFHDHTILPEGGDIALTLWAIGSYCFNAFRIYPKLCLSSPEKRCGKTTTMETLGAMTHRTLMASNVSPSTLFRSIECWQPSILIDEGDTFIDGNEELRGIINSGHTRSGASVLRCVGDDHEPKQFSTWAPMAIAMIKTPPDTIKDRSVMITLRRKMVGESVTRLPIEIAGAFKGVRSQCQRWAQDNIDTLKLAVPEIPTVGNDRAEDNWWALIAISDLLGGDWPQLARNAMRTIEGSKAEDDEAIGPMILSDIRGVFSEKRVNKITSSDLVDELIDLEERPWSEWKHGKPMTKVSLAKMLKPYGINSKKIRDGYDTKQGYIIEVFQDAFSRYLASDEVFTPSPPEIAGTMEQTQGNPVIAEGSSVPLQNSITEQNGTTEHNVPFQNGTQNKTEHKTEHSNPVIPRDSEKCSSVPFQSGNKGECTVSQDRENFDL